MADAKSNKTAIKSIAALLRDSENSEVFLTVATADLVDDGGAYSEPWCDTVVTLCNEIKTAYNLAAISYNEILALLQQVER